MTTAILRIKLISRVQGEIIWTENSTLVERTLRPEIASTVHVLHMYIFLELKHHPVRQPINSDRIYKHCRNLHLTRTNAPRIALPLSIVFERAGFENSYRRMTGIRVIAIVLIGSVALQLLLDDNGSLSGVSSWEMNQVSVHVRSLIKDEPYQFPHRARPKIHKPVACSSCLARW